MVDHVVSGPAVGSLIASLADNKYFLGRRYAEWCTAAPTLESAVAAASMAQDEIGHARSLYPLLRDVLGDSPEVEPETRTSFRNVPFLAQPFSGWTDFVAANFLFDTAINILLESATESVLGALSQRARRILEEEPLHWLHGEGWTRRLAASGPGVQDALRDSFSRVAPDSLSWFEVADEDLVRLNVLAAGPDELRMRYRDRVNPVLNGAGEPPV